MDLITIIRAIAGYFLVLLLPGYALTWALYPFRAELTLVERIALALVLSITSVMAAVLFADVYLGVDFTPQNIVVTILIITALAILIWRIRVLDAGKLRKKVKLRFYQFLKRIYKNSGVENEKEPHLDLFRSIEKR